MLLRADQYVKNSNERGGWGTTILSERDRAVIENGEHKGKAGEGQFLKRGEYVKI